MAGAKMCESLTFLQCASCAGRRISNDYCIDCKTWTRIIENKVRCPECRSDDIFDENKDGDTLCRECGYVLSARNMVVGAEWRNFSNEESNGIASGHRVGGKTIEDLWKSDDDEDIKLPPTEIGGTGKCADRMREIRKMAYKADRDFKLTEVDKEARVFRSIMKDKDYTEAMRDVAVKMYKDFNEIKRVQQKFKSAAFAAFASFGSAVHGRISDKKTALVTSAEFDANFDDVCKMMTTIRNAFTDKAIRDTASGNLSRNQTSYMDLLRDRDVLEYRVKHAFDTFKTSMLLPPCSAPLQILHFSMSISSLTGGRIAAPALSQDDLATATVAMACVCAMRAANPGVSQDNYINDIGACFKIPSTKLKNDMRNLSTVLKQNKAAYDEFKTELNNIVRRKRAAAALPTV